MKTVGIEEFAAWCVQSEWPKVGKQDLDEDAAAAAVLRGHIIRSTTGGRSFYPGLASMNWGGMVGGTVKAKRPLGGPHPDAVLFRHAIDALQREAFSPPYDIDDCLTDQRALALNEGERAAVDWRAQSQFLKRNSHRPASLVLAYAGMARAPTGSNGVWQVARPDWHEGQISGHFLAAETGGRPRWFVDVERRVRVSDNPIAYETRTFTEDGYDLKAKRPRKGAYRVVSFDPDPGFVARARHVYAVWWCSLEWLAAWMEAMGRLSAHKVLGPQGVEKPWQMAIAKSA